MVDKDFSVPGCSAVLGGYFQAHVPCSSAKPDRLRHELEEPRGASLEHFGPPTPTTQPAMRIAAGSRFYRHPDGDAAEAWSDADQIAADVTNAGWYHAILIDPRTGMLHCGSERAKGWIRGGVLSPQNSARLVRSIVGRLRAEDPLCRRSMGL